MQLTVLLLFTVYSVLIHTLPHTHAYTHTTTPLFSIISFPLITTSHCFSCNFFKDTFFYSHLRIN